MLPVQAQEKEEEKIRGFDYVMLVSKAVREDLSWSKLIEALEAERGGKIFDYNENPGDALTQLKQVRPHYVVVIDKMENVTPRMVKAMNMLSRIMDDDPYGDFVWGIITGSTPSAAMQFVTDAQMPQKVNMEWLNACELEKMCGFAGENICENKYKHAWKKWMSMAGEPIMAEAVFLQQQYIIDRLLAWNPKVLTLSLPEGCDGNTSNDVIRELVEKELNIEGTEEQIELLKHRDVMAYYGDPQWSLRLKKRKDNDFKVSFKKNSTRCEVTLEPGKKEVNVDEFFYFFPKQLEAPTLLGELQKGELIFNETFMILRGVRLEPGEKFQINFKVEGGDSFGKKLLKQMRPNSIKI